VRDKRRNAQQISVFGFAGDRLLPQSTNKEIY